MYSDKVKYRVNTLEGARYHDPDSPTIALVDSFDKAVDVACEAAFHYSDFDDVAMFAINHPDAALRMIEKARA
jgi:hypothetical protein